MDNAYFSCNDCKRKSCLKTKKPCQKVEEYLRKQGIYSANWIRPQVSKERQKDGLGRWREIPFSMLKKSKIILFL